MSVARTAVQWVARHWLVGFIAATFVFSALPLLAPILAAAGHDRASGWIYSAYRVTCHQMPHRSWFVLGPQASYQWNELPAAAAGESPLASIHQPIRSASVGYQVAFCQRDTAIYLSLFAVAVAYAGFGRRRLTRPLRWRWFAMALLPVAIDGSSQIVGLHESTPMLRTVTGALFGGAVALLVLPHLEIGFRELDQELTATNSPDYKLLVGTTNPGKAEEFTRILRGLAYRHRVSISIVFPSDIGLTTDVPESGATFEENSALKAAAYHELSGLPTLADDGGLEIDSLGGEPGVRSRRWLGAEADDEALIRHTLSRLESLAGPEERTARLRTCVTFVDDGTTAAACHSIDGHIAAEPGPRRIPGYPYRSLFIVAGLEKYYDELTADEHAERNHREHAVVELFLTAILPRIRA